MKTKLLSLLLMLVMLASLAACGGPDQAGQGGAEGSPKEEKLQKSSETLEPFRKEATLTETVMLDEGGVKVTATGLAYTESSADLAITIENNSGKDLSFTSGSLGYSCNSVNGYMVSDGYLNCDVLNGTVANDVISFSYDTLMLYGINEIADMEIGFDIKDADYNSIYFNSPPIYTSAFEGHDYETDHYQQTITSQASMNTYNYEMIHFSQEPLYAQQGVELLSSGVMVNQDGERALLLEMENTGDKTVYIATSDIGINGLTATTSLWSSSAVAPGKRCIVDVQLDKVLEPSWQSVYGVDEIGEISLSIGLMDENWTEVAEKVPVEIAIPGVKSSFDDEGTEVYNKNGLRMVAKTVLQDDSDYSSDCYVLLLLENNSGKIIDIQDVPGSLAVNGMMSDYSFSFCELEDGESAVLSITLPEVALEINQITSPQEIKEINIGFEIRNDREMIDEPTVTMAFEEEK